MIYLQYLKQIWKYYKEIKEQIASLEKDIKSCQVTYSPEAGIVYFFKYDEEFNLNNIAIKRTATVCGQTFIACFSKEAVTSYFSVWEAFINTSFDKSFSKVLYLQKELRACQRYFYTIIRSLEDSRVVDNISDISVSYVDNQLTVHIYCVPYAPEDEEEIDNYNFETYQFSLNKVSPGCFVTIYINEFFREDGCDVDDIFTKVGERFKTVLDEELDLDSLIQNQNYEITEIRGVGENEN